MSKGMKVRYIGKAQRRIVEQHEWNAANGFVQLVTSQAMTERLLANGGFEVVEEQKQEQEAN